MESQPNVNPHGSIHNQPRAGACLNCREKKVKCDKLQPCSTCSKKNESSLCLYGIERSEFLAARAEFQALTARRRQLYREEERDFLEDLLGDRDDDEISDADSDYQEVRAVTAKYAEDIIRFRATQREENDNGGGLLRIRSNDLSPEPRRRPRGSQRGVVRGPRKAAQPTGDIKARLSKAYEAFIKTNYDEARDVVEEIIRINAETHEAWQLLASIFTELKDTNNTFKALMIACSMTPKDVNAWIYCAEFGLYQTGSDRDGYIKSVHICYASAIRAAPRKVEARIAQADLRMEYGRAAAALKGYHQALLYSPHNLEILRKLATAYVEYGDNEKARVNDEKPRIQSIEKAKAEYQDSIAHYNKIENLAEPPFGWDDLMVYINLCTDLGHYEEAIKELKSLGRWLIGRGDEKYWDAFTDDDREWDDDDARRKDCPEFQAARYPLYTYGQGLPLEIRVKLGLCRLHLLHYRAALSHFEYLDPCDKTGQGIIFEYADLYRIVADSLYKANFHEQALTFYEPLQTLDGQSTASLQVAMGKCYVKTKNTSKAEECFKVAIRLDKDSKVARLQLANIYEQQNQPERAMLLVQELMSLISGPLSDVVQMRPRLHEASPEPIEEPSKPTKFSKFKRGVQINEADLADFLQLQFNRMRKEHKRMREGDRKATRAWMGAAKELIDDFRGCKPFYPWDKYIRFLGDPGTSQAKESETTMNNEVTEMADRLNLNIGEKTPAVALPVDYRGLKFDTWLDIFLEYAIILAKAGRTGEAYQICEAAKDSVIFYHSRESMFLIHIAWTTCALIANDEESCITVSRFFLRDYQFITDSYRLFGAVARMCQSPISWYNSGPSQKYILRQVKAMDYSLVDDETRARNFAYKGGYSAFDEEHENRIINTDMDTSLLMLYGYVLYTGTSYMYALNYFTRAHALDPNNPAIQLTMALSYIHWALKRQSDNRQYLILQGLSFLLRYYDNRKLSSKVEERQEAHYNVGRAYHLLGLTQISIPYYKRVLEEADHANTSSREDLVVDVAYNLQTIYSAAGNYELARAITDKYLVI